MHKLPVTITGGSSRRELVLGCAYRGERWEFHTRAPSFELEGCFRLLTDRGQKIWTMVARGDLEPNLLFGVEANLTGLRTINE